MMKANLIDSKLLIAALGSAKARDICIRVADPVEQRAAILQLRDKVYVREQGRLQYASALQDNVFGRFEKQSTYFIAWRAEEAVGTIRIISDSDESLPCAQFVDLENLRKSGRLVEFGHFLTLPAYRPRGLGLMLLREAFGFSVVCLGATYIMADIFADDASTLGPRYFLSRGFRQVGDIYADPRYPGSPRSMVVALDVNEGIRMPERATAVEDYRRRLAAVCLSDVAASRKERE